MRTHKGEPVSPVDLRRARQHVAQWRRENAKAIRLCGDYASHVSESEKDSTLQYSLGYADEIESGQHDNNFSVWQRMNTFLTGECIGFLPPPNQGTDDAV